MNQWSHIILFVIVCLKIEPSNCKIKDIYNWKFMDLKFPNDSSRQSLLENGFKLDSVFPEDFVVWRDKLFFAIDRTRSVPITLAYTDLNYISGTESPVLIPYPNWDANQHLEGEFVLHQVKRFYIDVCDRLWLLDNGAPAHRNKPARILVIDLKTDELIRVVGINILDAEGLDKFVIDVTTDSCGKAFVYITYPSTNITVYDFENDEAWEVEPRFDPASRATLPNWMGPVNEKCYQMDSIVPLLPQEDGHRPLFFESYSSDGQFVTTSEVLRIKPESKSRYPYRYLGYRVTFRPVLDEKTGIVFSFGHRTISCWNSIKHPNETSHETIGHFTRNETALSMRRIRPDGQGNLLLYFTRKLSSLDCKMTVQYKDGMGLVFSCTDISDLINYRISVVSVAEVIKGTVCENE